MRSGTYPYRKASGGKRSGKRKGTHVSAPEVYLSRFVSSISLNPVLVCPLLPQDIELCTLYLGQNPLVKLKFTCDHPSSKSLDMDGGH